MRFSVGALMIEGIILSGSKSKQFATIAEQLPKSQWVRDADSQWLPSAAVLAAYRLAAQSATESALVSHEATLCVLCSGSSNKPSPEPRIITEHKHPSALLKVNLNLKLFKFFKANLQKNAGHYLRRLRR